jgi:hypothetical protein
VYGRRIAGGQQIIAGCILPLSRLGPCCTRKGCKYLHHALHSAYRDTLARLTRTSSALLHSGTVTMRGCGNRDYSSPPQERASGGQETMSTWPEAALAHAVAAVAPCSLSTGSRETVRKGALSPLAPSSSPWADFSRAVGGALLTLCQSTHPTFACPFARNELCSVEQAPHGPRHTESWIENPRPRPLHDRHPAHHMRVTPPADR